SSAAGAQLPSPAPRSLFPASLKPSVKAVRRVIGELRVVPEECQPDRPRRTVTLLADDDLGGALVARIGVVVLVAVDEEDHVGVLLDRARFAKVGHDRTLVGALLERTVELRERDDGNVELLRKRLEAARDFRDLGGAILLVAWNLHQLQVIDHDEAEVVL